MFLKKSKRLLLSALLLSQSSFAATTLIIQWDTNLAELPQAQWLIDNKHSVTVTNLTPNPKRQVKALSFSVDDQQLAEVIFALRQYPAIKSINQDQPVKLQATPDDSDYLQQQHHTVINSATIWDQQTDCSNIKIAIIDSGIDTDHPDLVANIWQNSAEIAGNGIDDDNNGYIDDVNGYNVITPANLPEDDTGHGTHVAGLIAAVGNNSQGGAGVCWQANIVPIKVLDNNTNTLANTLAGLAYANTIEADVIVMSLQYDSYDQAIFNELEYAESLGNIVVTAAGNSNQDIDANPSYPASHSTELNNIIAVANIRTDLNKAGQSNYGALSVDIASPGVKLYSTDLDGSYDTRSGTSMSAPVVAGAVALSLANTSTATPPQIRSALINSANQADSLTWLSKSGGHLDLSHLLSSLANPQATLFGLAATDSSLINGNHLTEVSQVNFTSFVDNQTQSIGFTLIDDQTIQLDSPAIHPGYYQVVSSEGDSNNLGLLNPVELSAPTNLSVDPNGKNLAISWDAVLGADSYTIYKTKNSVITELTSTGTRYIDTNAAINTADLSYQVQAVYSYQHPVSEEIVNVNSALSPSSLPSFWLTEEIATIPSDYDFVNIRLQTATEGSIHYSVTGGNLPTNLYLSDNLGHIVGDPHEEGDFTISVTYSTGGSASATRQFAVSIVSHDRVLLDEPNQNIQMRFKVSNGQITSLQNKANTDRTDKSIRLSTFEPTGKDMASTIIQADPYLLFNGEIANIEVKTRSNTWVTLTNNDPNLSLNNGLSWKVLDASIYDLNETENLIEVEYVINWQTLPTTNTGSGEGQTPAEEKSSGGSISFWFLGLIGLISLRRR